ncbi:MAG: dihydrofolate reductase [Verrucomicrobiota bacterium]
MSGQPPLPVRPAVRLVLIAAASRNGVLASHGQIPWHLPRDVAHFRARTAGRWLLLGRITYEQMNGWFQPGHVPVVLTRLADDFTVPGGWAVSDVPAALRLAASHGVGELMVCGGGQVYAAVLPWADEIILTTVETEVTGETPFPELPADQWCAVDQQSFPADAANAWPMTITRWVRA